MSQVCVRCGVCGVRHPRGQCPRGQATARAHVTLQRLVCLWCLRRPSPPLGSAHGGRPQRTSCRASPYKLIKRCSGAGCPQQWGCLKIPQLWRGKHPQLPRTGMVDTRGLINDIGAFRGSHGGAIHFGMAPLQNDPPARDDQSKVSSSERRETEPGCRFCAKCAIEIRSRAQVILCEICCRNQVSLYKSAGGEGGVGGVLGQKWAGQPRDFMRSSCARFRA
jgi:hypothetical protein